ncbi:hypothetical protein [uncultured Methanobrevibacter sp.]|uniref:hypothetical protein n=1 Tax=uncultured Methanobrevibacter sp. TaxID=253161 RepID=UPI0025D36215|nr:hypothetical protein [uncultured Methanobrevibacter sp.]
MVFENVFSNFLANFNNFVDEKYILSDNAFVRKGKWSLETAIKFPLSLKCKNTTTSASCG